MAKDKMDQNREPTMVMNVAAAAMMSEPVFMSTVSEAANHPLLE